ncbi:MAG TPA: peptidoglycan DD-metalloendopeptidase family protein [Melioribacteraceae bacterium]|nr:peptidoglycan DD-metalloendopeptidase family protein [Melioribacteraceae bacterium]
MVSDCKKIVSALFLLSIPLLMYAQTADSIQQKNLELTNIKNEISRLENELRSKSKTEKESLQSLENINRQKLLLNKLVNNLVTEEKNKSQEIEETLKLIGSVENRIKVLKEKYSNYVVWVYKNRGLSLFRFLLNTDSFNQTIKRYRYLRYISQQNKITLNQLGKSRDELNLLASQLEKERSEKENLVALKQNEQKVLSDRESERKDLIKTLKQDQKMITSEIESKRKAEILIKNIIARLIEEERERKAKLLARKQGESISPPKYNYSNFQNFAELKGILTWPVSGGKVVRKFGENKNERLKTVTLNYGIDISVKGEQNVFAVAEGVVSAIDWIPGYGSIVILTHRDEYRTVYGHISNISVQEGDKISAGTLIGSVNESLEGNILHFEIWNERNYQNPEIWLARK